MIRTTGALLLAASVFLSGCDRSPPVLTLPEKVAVKPQPIPDFSDHDDVQQKKLAYFEYMNPKARVANDEVWEERRFVQALIEKVESEGLHEEELEALVELANYYRLEVPDPVTPEFLDQLLIRVDVVPASLVLAQSANESAWGSSRFARKGRNFFGIWCYEPGCGITPARRDAGARQEVKSFPTVLSGVRYYVRTINSGSSYARLRELRAAARAQETKPKGVHLAEGLQHYSERGEEYVDEIKRMIRQNKLASYSIARAEIEDQE